MARKVEASSPATLVVDLSKLTFLDSTGLRCIVTAEPINIGIRSSRFCIAADPTDRQGAWWWEPGPTGCSSRSTGPAVFHAENNEIMQHLIRKLKESR